MIFLAMLASDGNLLRLYSLVLPIMAVILINCLAPDRACVFYLLAIYLTIILLPYVVVTSIVVIKVSR